MNKIYSPFKISVFVLLFTLCSGVTYSQMAAATKFKPAPVTIDVLFCYSQPLPGLFGEVKDFFDFKSYGVKYGFGAQVNVKLATNKKGTIKPYLSLGYDLFLGKDDGNTFIDSNQIHGPYPFPGSQKTYSGNPIPGSSKMYIHDFLVAGGFEYDFVNKTRWTPYLGAELSMNVLFGTYKQTPNYAVPPANTTAEVSYTIKSATRFGFAGSAGIYLRIHQLIGFTFCTKYKFANLLAKSSDPTSGSADLNKINLLDKAATELNSNLTKDRNINYFEFLLGVSFFVGKR